MIRTFILFIFILLSLHVLASYPDTIKVTLEINNKPTSEPLKYISVILKTAEGVANTQIKNDNIIVLQSSADSVQIVILYKNKRIGTCFKYAPDVLKDLKAIKISLFVSKSAIKKQMQDSGSSVQASRPKSICIISTNFGTYCHNAYWK